MSLFTFGAPPLPQAEEADDNPDMIGIQNLQISELENNLQVAAGGVAAGGAGGGGATPTVNFPKVFYHNNPEYNPARLSFYDMIQETKTAMTFGGTSFITCGPTSNHLKSLNSALHMQYLHMVDTHIANTKDKSKVYEVNLFLFGTFTEVLHPTRMVMFRIYKNFRDYLFKPVFHTLYSTSPEAVPKNLIDEPMKEELFKVWLNCTV
jgi:hypothetical protein